jgi:hypothetical protein
MVRKGEFSQHRKGLILIVGRENFSGFGREFFSQRGKEFFLWVGKVLATDAKGKKESDYT